MTESETYQFVIAKAPSEDIGRDRVRLHWKRRLGRKRFVIVKLRHGTKHALASALGHDNDENVIQMDIDLRDKLGLTTGDKANITISIAPAFTQLRWYLYATDPAVRIPAWLGVWSFVVGVISIFPVYSWVGAIINRLVH